MAEAAYRAPSLDCSRSPPLPRVITMPGAETAVAMAKAAYKDAVKLSTLGTDVVGVGCTCALATDREKRGEHKAFVTAYNGTQERRCAAAPACGCL